jgi:hypothetical protein
MHLLERKNIEKDAYSNKYASKRMENYNLGCILRLHMHLFEKISTKKDA